MSENKIKCMIIDDEEPAIKVIKNYVQKVDSLELVATCINAFEAFNLLNKHEIDLIFIDIQMPQITGLEFLKSLNKPPKAILTTAYREYALDGFELDVIDYLLKPISFSRFLKAVGKVTRQVQAPTSPNLVSREADYTNAYMFVKCGKTMKKVIFNEIQFIESLRDLVKIHTNEEVIITYLKISYLEERLPSELFERVHKSFIIAIDKVDAYSANEIEIGKEHIPIGNFYKKQVLERLGLGGEV
ncbi:MAG: LytTR family DNA-binding domain-containing protein [Cyclobacteriaceae bacterium]